VRSGAVLAGLGFSLVAILGAAAPASAAPPQVTPRAGYYTGHEADKPSPLPVSFTVGTGRKNVLHFNAEAEVKAGCQNHLTGFEAPTAPMSIGTAGRFADASTAYPQKGVVVRVTGKFVSPTKATGLISVTLRRVKGCNASRAFTAQRTAAAAPPVT
jgi:hypothetical protein